jgi:hypothetical protein
MLGFWLWGPSWKAYVATSIVEPMDDIFEHKKVTG